MLLNVTEYGAGHPVVVLHGLFGSSRNWQGLAKRMARDHHVLVMDLRNHGDSPWDPVMSYPAMADDLRETLLAHGIRRCKVVGHSMGGKAAMALALAHPEMVERLTVVDIAPVAYRTEFRAYAEAMLAIPVERVTSRTDADAVLAETVPEPGVRAFLLHNLELAADGAHWRPNLRVLADCMDEIGGWPEYGSHHAYGGPSLFLTGGASDYVRPKHHASIKAHFPHAKFHAIPGAGHWVHAEQPKAFLAALGDFLA